MSGRQNNRGAALLIVVLGLLLVAGLGAALIEVTRLDTMSASRFASADAVRYAAESALDAALAALSAAPDWSLVLAGIAPSPIAGDLRFDDRSPVDLVAFTVDIQRASDQRYSGAANRPLWTPYAHIALAQILPGAGARNAHYLLAWVGDDDAETDANPLVDSNGVILVHAESRTATGSRAQVEAAIARSPPQGVRLLWLRTPP